MFTRPKFNIDRGWEVTDTITDIIAIYLDPNSYVPAHHAALQIDDLRPDRRMHEDGEEVESLWGFIGSLWDCILEIAQEVHQSDMRRRLVQLAEALYMTDTTLLESPEGSRSLPSLNETIYDFWSRPNRNTASTEQEEQWINLNSFVASLFACNVVTTIVYGFDAVGSVLEEPPWPSNKGLSCDIIAAAQWMELSARSMLAVFRRQVIDEHNQPTYGYMNEFQDSDRLSWRRWELWKAQFEYYASRKDLLDAAQLSARRAAIAMAEAVAAEGDFIL